MQVAPGHEPWRAQEADRLPCSSWLATFYGRRHGALVGSGTAALELALRQLGVNPTWRVAVPAATCHQVAAAVLNVGAHPVIVSNAADLLLEAHAVKTHLAGLDALIAVHQFGLPCDIPGLRRCVGEQLPIIEDSACAWGIQMPGATRVITSLGQGKPVDIGGGGALFADTAVDAEIDTWSAGQRQRRHPALAPALSVHALPHLAIAVARAQQRAQRLRPAIAHLLGQLRGYGLQPWEAPERCLPSWQFVPIRTETPTLFQQLRHSPHAEALGVCAPAADPLDQLPMLRGRSERAEGPQAAQPLHQQWVLLDPLAALEQPDQLAAWAEGARHASLHP